MTWCYSPEQPQGFFPEACIPNAWNMETPAGGW